MRRGYLDLRPISAPASDLGARWVRRLFGGEDQYEAGVSVQAISWAFSQRIKPATTKLVLVALCDYVNDECLAYPAVDTLCDKTSLNRKTVHEALSRLVEMEKIADTGQRRGATGRVVVYRVMVPKTDQFKQARKRNSSENGIVPFLPPNCPENGTLNCPENGTQNHKGNRKEPKGFREPSVEEVRAYCQERGNSVNPQTFVDHYTAKGWLIGKAKMKDWKAAVRTWEHRQRDDRKTGSDDGVVF